MTWQAVCSNCEIRLFADDALIYTIGHTSQEINDNLNTQMQKNWEMIKK